MEKTYFVVDFSINRIVGSNLTYDEAITLSLKGKSLFDRVFLEE
jgi:hypothetical protein